MKDLKGRVAVVTGAGSGIGRAMALEFASQGMKVVASDVEIDSLEGLEDGLKQIGNAFLVIPCDVRDPDQMEGLAEAAYEEFGAVHLLCNNAGVGFGGVPTHEVSLKDWDWVLGVNLWGVIHGQAAFLPRMLAGGEEGHIVNTASILGMMTIPNVGPYAASKFAVVGLSEVLASELAETPLNVSIVCPFWVRTAIFESERNRPEDLQTGLERPKTDPNNIPWSWLEPEDVARIVREGVEADRFYIFTHPDTSENLEPRFEKIRADFPKK